MTDTALPPGFEYEDTPASSLPPGFEYEKPSTSFGDAALDTIGGLAASAGSGLYKGAEMLAASPRDLLDLAGRGVGYGVEGINNLIFGAPTPEERKKMKAKAAEADKGFFGGTRRVVENLWPSTEQIQGVVDPAVRAIPGASDYVVDYEAKGPVEKSVQTVGSFVPAALLSPGSIPGKLSKFAVAPGLASEGAGALTKGTKFEPYARAMAAIVGGGLAAWAGGPGVAAKALRAKLPAGVSPGDVDAAENLITAANGRGIGLTWPEALAKVTNGRVDLTDVQRFLEQSQSSRPIMTDYMAGRPGQVQSAAEGELNKLTQGARLTDPVAAGLRVQKVSIGAIDKLNRRINDVTRSLYSQAGPRVVTQSSFNILNQDPLFREALASIRSDPVYMRTIAGYPDQSVQALDAVKKWLDAQAGKAATVGDRYATGVYGNLAGEVKNEAAAVSPEYQRALERQAKLRQGVLEPAKAGPLGKMAETDNLQAQAKALLPRAPSEGSQHVVGQVVRRLSARDKDAAFQLIRDYLATTFHEASQATRAGPNQWGGANWAAEVRGNLQQAKNLEAAIKALPGGKLRWDGLNELLDVMEATGKRQGMGSPTQANQALSESLTRGTPIGIATSLASSPTRMMSYGREIYEGFRLGKNTEQLARMITDPKAAPLLKRLLNSRTAQNREAAIMQALYYWDREMHRGEEGAQLPANPGQ